MDKSKIEELAKTAHEKREYFNMLGMMNTNVDYEERQKQSVQYEIARTEMIEAEAALRKEQGL